MYNLDDLTAFVTDHRDRFCCDLYSEDLSLSLMQVNTYPGGMYIRKGPLKFMPCYYIQSVPLFDSGASDAGNEQMLWNMVWEAMKLGVKKLRTHLKRSLFRELHGISLPDEDDFDIAELPSMFPISTTNAPEKVREIVSYEELMWCESFDSLKVGNDRSPFRRLPYRTDKLEPAKWTEQLWVEHFESIAPIGAYNDPDHPPEAPYHQKYSITSPEMYMNIMDCYGAPERFVDRALWDREFPNLRIRDEVPLVAEPMMVKPAVDNHQIYTLDFQWLTLEVHEQYNVKIFPWMRMPNALGAYTLITWFGNMTFEHLDTHGCMMGLDPNL